MSKVDFEKWLKQHDPSGLLTELERRIARIAYDAATAIMQEQCAKLVEDWPGIMQYEEGCYCADIDDLAIGIRAILTEPQ